MCKPGATPVTDELSFARATRSPHIACVGHFSSVSGVAAQVMAYATSADLLLGIVCSSWSLASPRWSTLVLCRFKTANRSRTPSKHGKKPLVSYHPRARPYIQACRRYLIEWTPDEMEYGKRPQTQEWVSVRVQTPEYPRRAAKTNLRSGFRADLLRRLAVQGSLVLPRSKENLDLRMHQRERAEKYLKEKEARAPRPFVRACACACVRARSGRGHACAHCQRWRALIVRRCFGGYCTQAKKQAAEQEALQKKLRSRTCLLL